MRHGLPLRYINYNPEEALAGDHNFDNNYSKSAYPAYAIELLSETTKTDLYSLLCQIHQPEYKAVAKKQLIHAIDSVRDGLYRELRELEYTPQDFINGLETVRRAIDTGTC